jgi:AcrR family transcriptional regulator
MGNITSMSSQSKQRMPAAERQRRIEEAAIRLFAERGPDVTTVEDIVRAAGVTKPMLYRHFESKQELCIALLERIRDELIGAPLARYAPGADDPSEQRARMLDAWFGYVEDHPEAARFFLTPITGDSELAAVQRELFGRQRATQRAMLREFAPELGDAEAEPLAEALRASLNAVALWWLDHPDVPRPVPLAVLRRLAEGVAAP